MIQKFATVAWSEQFARAIRWPKVRPDSFGIHRYYANWKGTITGPLNNIVGLGPFLFRVDSMLEFRAPRRDDCSS